MFFDTRQFSRPFSRCVTAVLLSVGLFALGLSSAEAQDRDPDMVERSEIRSAKAASKSLSTTDVASALDLESDQVESVDFGTSDEDGFGTLSESAANFPVEGDSYLALSSGFTDVALDPDNSGSTSGALGGLRGPGNATDMVQMELELNVPEGATEVSFDFKFLSEEFPEFVGSQFNDGFVVERGSSDFTVDGSTLKAENNLAFDDNGNPITVNTTFDLSGGEAAGTTYDGATSTLKTTVSLPTGKDKVTLIFSIFDVADRVYDSAVFIDDVQFDEPPAQNLVLEGLEVIQSVQNWNNDVPLIQGKNPTWVRAHLRNKGDEKVDIDVPNLRVVGEPSTGLGQKTDVETGPGTKEVPLVQNTTINKLRANWDETVNYQIDSDWNGTVTIELDAEKHAVDCPTTASANSDANCEIEVEFTDVPEVEMEVVRYVWKDQSGSENEPNLDKSDIQREIREAESRLPAELNFNVVEEEFPGGKRSSAPEIGDVNDALIDRAQDQDGFLGLFGGNSNEKIYYGFIANPNESGGARVYSNLPPYSGGIAASQGGGARGTTPAHEIGHLFDQPHAVKGSFVGGKEGVCPGSNNQASTAPFYVTDFPYFRQTQSGDEIAALGPIGEGVDERIWGVDFSSAPEVTGPKDLAGEDENPELMSYCENPRWISEHTYNEVRESITDDFGKTLQAGEAGPTVAGTQPVPTSKSAVQEEYISFRGRIDLSTNTVEFRSSSLITLSPGEYVVPEEGEYRLEALNGDGDVVESVPFTPSRGSEGNTQFLSFRVPVPKNPDIEEVRIVEGESNESNAKAQQEILGSLTASPNAPSITLESPGDGTVLSGGQVSVEWSGNDADGDDLTYRALYSANGGQSWQLLASSPGETSLNVDLEKLSGSSDGIFRVQASDGFNVAEDRSTGITVPGSAPDARIQFPSDGAQFSLSRTFTLYGTANDLEDGELEGSALQWKTEEGEVLGTGEAEVQGLDLGEGTHTITLEATDSDGATDEVSVTIEITAPDSETEESEEEDTGTATGQVFYPLEGQSSLQVGRTVGNVQVEVRSEEGGVLGTATTGEDGSFQLQLPAGGPYEASVDPESVGQSLGAAGQHVDVFDLVRAAQALFGFDPLVGPFHEKVADVDGSGGLQSPDLFQIIRFTNGTIGGFEAGPWAVGTEENLQVESGGVATGVDLEVAERGDVDLSGGAASAGGQSKSEALAIETTRSGTAPLQPGETAEVPVRLEGGAAVGAYALALEVPSDKIELKGVEAPAGAPEAFRPEASLEEGTLTVGWAGVEEPPLEVGAGEELLALKVAVPENVETEAGLEIEVAKAAAIGPEGAPLEGATLAVPALEAGPEEFALKGSRPNPASGPARIVVDLPERAAVTVRMYNMLGQRVKTIQETMAAGTGQALQLDGSGLSSGQYFYRVQAELGDKTVRETGRLTVVR